jgi:hypothetical protein
MPRIYFGGKLRLLHQPLLKLVLGHPRSGSADATHKVREKWNRHGQACAVLSFAFAACAMCQRAQPFYHGCRVEPLSAFPSSTPHGITQTKNTCPQSFPLRNAIFSATGRLLCQRLTKSSWAWCFILSACLTILPRLQGWTI